MSTSCADAITGLAVRASIAAPNTPFTMTVTGVGTTRTVTINAMLAGNWLFRLWLVDSATDLNTITLTPPSGSDTTVWYKVTESDGTLTLTITNNTVDTWYLAAVLLAPVGVSSALAYI